MFFLLAVVGWVLTVLVSLVYFKAGMFKLTAPIDTLVGAGMAWVKEIPTALVRLIALLEIIGVFGLVVAQVGFEVGVLAKVDGFLFAQWFAVAAAAGLTLTMIVAALMHIVRKEFKYTWKMNVRVIVLAGVLTAALALMPTTI
jgi:hypothetical protein